MCINSAPTQNMNNFFPSQYARLNNKEYFAESVENFVFSPAHLLNGNPGMFHFIREEMFKGRDFLPDEISFSPERDIIELLPADHSEDENIFIVDTVGDLIKTVQGVACSIQCDDIIHLTLVGIGTSSTFLGIALRPLGAPGFIIGNTLMVLGATLNSYSPVEAFTEFDMISTTLCDETGQSGEE